MNKNVVHQSSPVHQVMAAGGPNWWNINNLKAQDSHDPPPPKAKHSSPVSAHQHPNLLQQYPISSLSPWNESQELPYQSLSQLLMDGMLISEEDKVGLSHVQQQAKKLDILEEQLLHQEDSNGSNFADHVKQDNLTNNYHVCTTISTTTTTTSRDSNITNAEVEQAQMSKPSWSQVMSASSPTSCVTNLSTNMLDFTNSKSDGRHPVPDRSAEGNSTDNGGVAKKARLQPSSNQSSTFRVRKEKLGDRITALHQLVSPFGKTDTASVLSEALGYIRFLQSQVEALSLPYLGSESAKNSNQHQSESVEEVKKDLRSKGLCLVPISCTLQVESDNGADYWAQAAALGADF